MFKYKYLEKYDDKYKIKDREIACYSKSAIKNMYPDGNYNVIGETRLNNKKDKLDTIKLAEEELVVSKEGSHSKLFFKKAGYIQDVSGDYIIFLKRRWIILWILLGFIAAGIITSVLLFPKEPGEPYVEPPDITKTETDTVFISLPSGNIDYRMSEDASEFDGINIELYMTHDGQEDLVHKQEFAIDENGNIADDVIDFPSMPFELIEGDYDGRIVYELPDGSERISYVKIIIRSSKTGSMTIDYSSNIAVNKALREVALQFGQGEDATHDVILQIILKKENNEILLAESGTIRAGESVTKLALRNNIADISRGQYDGYIRLYIVDGSDVSSNTKMNIAAHIIVE